jgi:Cd2+/Zn2+-exporting ATPase
VITKGPADHIAQELGIDEVRAELLPENKQEIIQELKDQGAKVAMIGDGVNDAPALALADLGIAMGGAGTDVAMETADVVLMGDELEKIPYLVDLSRKTRRTLWFNLGLAFSLIFMMIGAIFFFDLPLPLAVLGHEGGTVLVSLNGLRLFFSREAKPAISVSEASAAGA